MTAARVPEHLSKQPDDPGTELGGDLNGIIIFKEDMLRRRTAWFGSIMIGQVIPTHGRFQKATVMIDLPNVPRTSFPASSISAGERILSRVAHRWLDDAGLVARGAA